MTQLGFYVNQADCIGCHTCQIACKDKNNLDIGVLFRNVHSFDTGKFPNVGRYHVPATCNHCGMPACISVCPVNAIIKDPDNGVVHIDKKLCNACKACIDACPYGIPVFIESKNTVSKCDFCRAELSIGENPVCVDACPMRCLEYGDITELKSKHASEDVTDALPCLPDPARTVPSLAIAPRASAKQADFVETFQM